MKKVLIVSPHPDDEVLGCGGTICHHKKNKDKVFWLIMTNVKVEYGWDKLKVFERSKEIKRIYKLFNFDDMYNLNYPTTHLDSVNPSKLIKGLKKIINTINPNIVYLPFSNDPHSDHKITTESFNSCIKPFRHKSIEKVLMYETLSETNFNFLSQRKFNPNVFIDISKYLTKKIKAMNVYKSEIGIHPFPRSTESIKSLAILRGSQVNFKLAEAFELVYEIQRSE